MPTTSEADALEVLSSGDAPAPGPLGLSLLSRVHLDELLAEVLERIGEISRLQERHGALLEAVVGIGAGLDLRGVLDRIVAAASTLAGARYGALGVLSADGHGLSEFVTYGISPEERARLGALPQGHGILGVLIERPEPLRLRNLSDHPSSVGIPPNHPPMTSFLGVPIRVGDRVFGNLYLTEKLGGSEFTDEDEEIVVALAAAAGVVVENARLYERAAQRERWRAAEAEITGLLLGELDRTAVLALVARRAREVAGADVGLIALSRPGKRSSSAAGLRVEIVDGKGVDGRGTEVRRGASPPLQDVADEVVRSGRPLVVHSSDSAQPRTSGAEPPQHPPTSVYAGRPAVGVLAPLPNVAGVDGVLMVLAAPEQRRAFTDLDAQLVQSFAAQAALALESAQAREDRALLALLEERERIARDMHDLVIQRVFAAGLKLQGASRLAGQPEVAQRVSQVIDELDTVISDIRSVIFQLHSGKQTVGLEDALRAVAAEAEATLGLAPALRIGEVPAELPESVRDDAVAALRELLSNVARHAHAAHVLVTVTAEPDLRLTVEDDGVGLAERYRESGLRNLRERAERHGGSCVVRPRQPRGTVVSWVVHARVGER